MSELKELLEWVDEKISMDKRMSIVYRIHEAEEKIAQAISLIESKERQISNLQDTVGLVARHTGGKS